MAAPARPSHAVAQPAAPAGGESSHRARRRSLRAEVAVADMSHWHATGHGASVHGVSGEATQWADVSVVLTLDSIGMGTLRGDGFSLVPRESRAAWGVLYAIEQREQDEIAAAVAFAQQQQQQLLQAQQQQQQEEQEEYEVDEEQQQEDSDDETEVHEADPAEVDVSPLPEWTPSAELLARQPALLRIPFLLEGAWVARTGELVLTKRHVEAVNNEIRYTGTMARHDGAATTFALQMECPFAAATLSLTCDPQRAPLANDAAVAMPAQQQQQRSALLRRKQGERERAEGEEEEEEDDDAHESECGSLEPVSGYSSATGTGSSSPGAASSRDGSTPHHVFQARSQSVSPHQVAQMRAASAGGIVAAAAASAGAAAATVTPKSPEASSPVRL